MRAEWGCYLGMVTHKQTVLTFRVGAFKLSLLCTVEGSSVQSPRPAAGGLPVEALGGDRRGPRQAPRVPASSRLFA